MSVAYEMVEGKAIAVPATRPRYRFSLADYMQMIEFGILDENDNLELIRGELVQKMTIGDPHAACVDRLTRLFSRLFEEDVAIVRIQNPVIVLDSRPEPDVVLAVSRDDDYATSTPLAADVLLLIEVADSSLEYDRTEKLSLYAEAGVCEYWIANLIDECVEVHRDPKPNGTYADERVLKFGETLNIVRLPGISVPVEDIFKGRLAPSDS
ncbi:MAG: Uma2 family endonuclease [Planctomycetaceae bacterium]